MVEYFNGISNTTVYKSKGDEFAVTNSSNVFSKNCTNGMQFRPKVDNQNQ